MGLFSDRRARAVLLVLSLLGVGRESVLPHECATMAAATSTHATEASTASATHAGHGHAAADEHAPSEAPADHECDCIGECCCAPVATLALARADALVPIAVDEAATRTAASDERLPVAPRYLRPFAIGPPAVITA